MADTNGDEAKQVNNGADATDALLVSAGDDVPVGGGGGGPRIVAGMGAAAAAVSLVSKTRSIHDDFCESRKITPFRNQS